MTWINKKCLSQLFQIYQDEEAAKYLSGMAVHWYMSKNDDTYDTLTKTHQEFPDKFIIASEACEGYQLFTKSVKLGAWERGERYSYDIIQVTFLRSHKIIMIVI